MDKNLNCIFLHHKNPFLKIGPFKYEFLNKEPGIGLVHDLISDKVVQKMKQDAKPKLITSPYESDKTVAYTRWRTSKVTYFDKKSNKNALKVSKNIELVTKSILAKNKYDSENLQVRYFDELLRECKDASAYDIWCWFELKS